MSHVASGRAAGWTLFAALLLAYGWFHQGGGWNQNVRFAQVRALAHDRTFAVDDQLLYTLATDATGRTAHRRLRLSDPATRSTRLPRAVSLDLSEHAGHFYPNKPPGLSLLALPGYLLQRPFTGGDDGDTDGWSLTLALYWTGLLSVGLLSALGGVAFFDVAGRWFPGASMRARGLASLAYALGTPVFAYATFLIDHAVVASLSLFALRSLLVARDAPRAGPLFAAGSFAGLAVVVNHSAALTALGLGAYALALPDLRRRVGAYVLGGVAPALFLAVYQQLCFGSPFALPQHHQLGLFQSAAPVLGVFGAPRPELLPRLLFIPYRGLFFWSPVLAVGALAALSLLRDATHRREALLCLGLFLAFLLMNASFNAWHGGGTFGPRYLVPAIPFLALPLVRAFERTPRTAGALAALSVASALLVTAVSPQLDAAIHRPLTGFYLPLWRGEAVESGGFPQHGPVSAHPTGFVGDGIQARAGVGTPQHWSSFNLGEALFPESRWSLAPLGLLLAGVGWLGLRRRPAG
ncbi:MAG: hypothetical protein ACQGVC_23860 [Myxococcota bacterium]